MSNTGAIVGGVLGAVAAVVIVLAMYNSIIIVREKQQVVLERWGRFRSVLTPGIHFIFPWVDRCVVARRGAARRGP